MLSYLMLISHWLHSRGVMFHKKHDLCLLCLCIGLVFWYWRICNPHHVVRKNKAQSEDVTSDQNTPHKNEGWCCSTWKTAETVAARSRLPPSSCCMLPEDANPAWLHPIPLPSPASNEALFASSSGWKKKTASKCWVRLEMWKINWLFKILLRLVLRILKKGYAFANQVSF